MIEVRPIENEPVLFANENFKFIEFRPFNFDKGLEVYEDDVGIQAFRMYDKKTRKLLNDDIFVGYNIPKDIKGFIVCKNLNEDYILMTENGEEVSRIYPEESNKLGLFLERIAKEIHILAGIKSLSFFANREVKKQLLSMHTAYNQTLMDSNKNDIRKVSAYKTMYELEHNEIKRIYETNENKIIRNRIKQKHLELRNKNKAKTEKVKE